MAKTGNTPVPEKGGQSIADQIYQSMTRDIMSRVVDPREAADDFVLGIMHEIITAESVDGVFAAQDAGSSSGRDRIDEPFYAASITWVRSNRTGDGSFPAYARIQGYDLATQEAIEFSCGGLTVITVLWRLEQFGAFAKGVEENGFGMPLVLRGKSSATNPDHVFLTVRPVATRR